MKKLLCVVVGCVLGVLLIAGLQHTLAGQRIRLIDVDSATTPAATTAVNVSLAPAANTTNTIAVQTMVITNLFAGVTNIVTVVTNVQGIATSYGFSQAQAGGILTNANLLYKLLQSY